MLYHLVTAKESCLLSTVSSHLDVIDHILLVQLRYFLKSHTTHKSLHLSLQTPYRALHKIVNVQ